MASIVAVAGSSAVVGLGTSSLSGKKLKVSARPVSVRAAPSVGVVAKYDTSNSKYFDLEDLGNTTGAWDLYGQDQRSPYNGLQSKFFETFAAPFTKRGILLKLGLLGGALALGFASSSATGDVLAIKKGPQEAPVPGPRGRL
ncbi:hypothetical protein R1flu_024768 [Riccia fluitans]|uniref:Photosystem I reaction center subunit VI, chloroplastic n=1 Tax=Riccia fluitans TaxID=41844 RepID=A0ABD1XYX6_9MARC